MSEYDNNEFEVDPEQVEESLDADAKPLCFDCLCECNPLSYYCEHCNSSNPINPLAAYMPFVRLRMICGFYVTAWRRMWYDKDISAAFRALLVLFVCFYIPCFTIFASLFLFYDRKTISALPNKLKTPLIAITVFVILLRFFWILISLISFLR